MQRSRIEREKKTIRAMIAMYCGSHHSQKKGNLCGGCAAVESYALEKINRCPFINDKPTCVKCPVHCYMPEKREKVREIMRYAGPRMLFFHPVMAFFHVLDGLRDKKRPPDSYGRG